MNIPWSRQAWAFGQTKKAWKRILHRAGIKNLGIHDLRMTLRSYQAIMEKSLTLIGESLGHKTPQSTSIYARLSNDRFRASMKSAFDFYKKNTSAFRKAKSRRTYPGKGLGSGSGDFEEHAGCSRE
jgi:integrase